MERRSGARSIENMGDSLPSIAERTGGYDEDVLEYARSVHQAGPDDHRGLSQYGERQVETEIDTQTEYHRASQEDRDIDLDTQGSRDGRVEFAIGDATGSPTAWSEIERQQDRAGRTGNGERASDTRTREEMLELEDVHMPGSQRAAVDIAVAERLRESGVLTEDDICAAAYLELDGNEPLASIHEDGEVASRSGGIGESDISDMTDTKMAPPTSPTPRVIPEVPPGFEGRPGISGIGKSREGRSPGAPEAKVMGSPEPVTPTVRSSSKKARRSPEHNTPGRNAGDANMEDYTIEDQK